MPVNYTTPSAASLYPVVGVRLGIAEAGIRKVNRHDLTLIELAAGSRVAGVFTQNRFCAAPVQVCQQHLAGHDIRALLINTGIANAGTGEAGLVAARATCGALAALLGLSDRQVLPFSTGVIMESLPLKRIVAALPNCRLTLRGDSQGWFAAAHAIMTTDTVAKIASRQIDIAGKTIAITGMSKGAGMIKPNMATMLGFIATDAAIAQPLLEQMVKQVADVSFNCISVDGDTSTNDSFILIATGGAGNPEITAAAGADYITLREAVSAVAVELAGHRARRRRRHQVHRNRRRRRARCRRVQGGRLCHRAFAAGENRFLRCRSQPWPDSFRHRQRRPSARDTGRS